jgi:valine--pyruvate aminotransferase
MKFPLSEFGENISARSGILELMADLGEAMTLRPDMIMMGGGNPAHIPEVQKILRDRIGGMVTDDGGSEIDRMLSNYDPPQGSPAFLSALADCLNAETGWNLSAKNIAITSGGQTAFFFLFNMLADTERKVVLPLAPEYIGYANQGTCGNLFRAHRPIIEEDADAPTFKYHVNFDRLSLDGAAAVCVSRPTNPSGNVLTDGEIARLAEMAEARGIPLIIDNAYGNPFPGAIFCEATPIWNENIILTLSLSKLGLPGARTGIVIAHEDIIERVASITAVSGLANNNIGQTIVRPLVESGEITRMSREIIRPFYEKCSLRTQAMLVEAMDGLPCKWHRSEGAFFLWLWFPGLPIPTSELYQRLKDRNVLIVPGEYFFFGLPDEANDWAHRHECIRMTFTMPEEKVREGIRIIADEVRRVFDGG